MSTNRPIHPDFDLFLQMKDAPLIQLYSDLRSFILNLFPESNELLYHTHALTSVYSVSEKTSDGFCLVPIYSKHLNLGFSKGTLLEDPDGLLQGTGKLMRHIPISSKEDYDKDAVIKLLVAANKLAIEDQTKPSKISNQTISKIKI